MKCVVIVFFLVVIMSCGSTQPNIFSLEAANRGRVANQAYVEDSSLVFFASYPNPFYDRSFLWFWCFKDGDVELVVRDAIADTVEAIYVFQKQDVPEYSLAIRPNGDSHLVTSTVRLSGREKCIMKGGRWTPTPDKQDQRTKYTIKRK